MSEKEAARRLSLLADGLVPGTGDDKNLHLPPVRDFVSGQPEESPKREEIPCVQADETQQLRVGEIIRLDNLKMEQFNGLTAVVFGFKPDGRVICEFNTVVHSELLSKGNLFCVKPKFCTVGHEAWPRDGGKKVFEQLRKFMGNANRIEEDGTGGLNIFP